MFHSWQLAPTSVERKMVSECQHQFCWHKESWKQLGICASGQPLDQRWMSPGHKHPSSAVSDRHYSGMWQTVSPELFLEMIQSHFLLLLTSPLHPHPCFSFFPHHICWQITFTGTPWVMLLGSSTWDIDHAQMPASSPLESLIDEHLAPKVVHRQTEVALYKNKYRQFLPWEGWSWVRETGWVITFDVAKTPIEIHRHVPSESRDNLVTGNLVYDTLKPCLCPGTLPFPGCLGPTLLLFCDFYSSRSWGLSWVFMNTKLAGTTCLMGTIVWPFIAPFFRKRDWSEQCEQKQHRAELDPAMLAGWIQKQLRISSEDTAREQTGVLPMS